MEVAAVPPPLVQAVVQEPADDIRAAAINALIESAKTDTGVDGFEECDAALLLELFRMCTHAAFCLAVVTCGRCYGVLRLLFSRHWGLLGWFQHVLKHGSTTSSYEIAFAHSDVLVFHKNWSQVYIVILEK